MSESYRIGEVAKMLNVATSVIRYWESVFPQLSPKRTEKGQRFYTEQNVKMLLVIQDLLHNKGMTIAGVRRLLKKGKEQTLLFSNELDQLALPNKEDIFRSETFLRQETEKNKNSIPYVTGLQNHPKTVRKKASSSSKRGILPLITGNPNDATYGSNQLLIELSEESSYSLPKIGYKINLLLPIPNAVFKIAYSEKLMLTNRLMQHLPYFVQPLQIAFADRILLKQFEFKFQPILFNSYLMVTFDNDYLTYLDPDHIFGIHFCEQFIPSTFQFNFLPCYLPTLQIETPMRLLLSNSKKKFLPVFSKPIRR